MSRGELATCVRCGELPRWDRSLTVLCVICFRCDLARADERETVLGIISERINDLRTCGKADDCESQARGVELALADLRDAWGLT